MLHTLIVSRRLRTQATTNEQQRSECMTWRFEFENFELNHLKNSNIGARASARPKSSHHAEASRIISESFSSTLDFGKPPHGIFVIPDHQTLQKQRSLNLNSLYSYCMSFLIQFFHRFGLSGAAIVPIHRRTRTSPVLSCRRVGLYLLVISTSRYSKVHYSTLWQAHELSHTTYRTHVDEVDCSTIGM